MQGSADEEHEEMFRLNADNVVFHYLTLGKIREGRRVEYGGAAVGSLQ